MRRRKASLQARRNQGGQAKFAKYLPDRLRELHAFSGQAHRRLGRLSALRGSSSRQGLVFGVREEGLTVITFNVSQVQHHDHQRRAAAILAGVWLADVYREHDSRAMLLPDRVITLFPDRSRLRLCASPIIKIGYLTLQA